MDPSTVAKYNTLDTGIWIIIDSIVYDITDFIVNDLHPAGSKIIKPYFGKDATKAFKAASHPHSAIQMLQKFKIGTITSSEAHTQNDTRVTANSARELIRPQHKSVYVTKIFIYPVKGCQSIKLNSVQLSHDGLLNDRIYAICNKRTRMVVNQLMLPKLSQIRTSFVDPKIENFDDGIKLNDIIVPLIHSKESEVSVRWKSCSSRITAYDQGQYISEWITNYIGDKNGERFMLIRVSESNYRTAEDYYKISGISAEKTSTCDEMSGFQNYCSVLLSSEESLNELNSKYDTDHQLSWQTAGFRMNIIVSGLHEAHYEDFMKHVVFHQDDDDVNECELLWSRRRYFCAVPQVNQVNSETISEPMKTAAEYRGAITLNDRCALPGDDAVFFGSFYAIKKAGCVYVGQRVISACDQLDGSRLDYKSVHPHADNTDTISCLVL